MKYRKAHMTDAGLLLKWKNQADTRKWAIKTHDKITLENHLKWLSQNLEGNFIIGDNYGTIRIDNNEISIRIDTKHQGNGYATQAIKYFSKKGMQAKIVDGNVASMRTFIKCGYSPIKHERNFYILQKS